MSAENLSFRKVIEITKKVASEFEKIEQRPWNIEGTMLELSKQVGDLSKHIMVFEKYYGKERENRPEYRTSKENIADELVDIFYCLVRISKEYKIDFEEAILKTWRKELKMFGRRVDF